MIQYISAPSFPHLSFYVSLSEEGHGRRTNMAALQSPLANSFSDLNSLDGIGKRPMASFSASEQRQRRAGATPKVDGALDGAGESTSQSPA
jgi:hypothetical protein